MPLRVRSVGRAGTISTKTRPASGFTLSAPGSGSLPMSMTSKSRASSTADSSRGGQA